MSLVVLTGPVRSGKSRMAERLAAVRGVPVTVAVGGWDGDEEMARRIAAHEASRPEHWSVIAATVDAGWLADVPADSVLVLDCLGTLVSNACFAYVGEAEIAPAEAESAIATQLDVLLAVLLGRRGDTIVVTNETGWGVVPDWPSARVFRDELGRANRRLIDAADVACLVVAGRCIDLKDLRTHPDWPTP
jgi:adenosylcobinamide kinase/adenosylcobinamide-phosphate guanylyltransferase